jgi:poly(3-hydroxybutyrate) depolymerase
MLVAIEIFRAYVGVRQTIYTSVVVLFTIARSVSLVAMILPSLLSFLALVAATKDCQAPLQSPGTYQEHTIHSSNIRRKYILFLPSNYGQSASAPLILNFPGHGDSDDYQRTLTLMDETFFNTDYIIVYPQGSSVRLLPSAHPR